jgi:hypothetical protein
MPKVNQRTVQQQTIVSTASKSWTVAHVFDAATEQTYRTWIDPAAPTVIVRSDWVGPRAPVLDTPTSGVRGKAPDVS